MLWRVRNPLADATSSAGPTAAPREPLPPSPQGSVEQPAARSVWLLLGAATVAAAALRLPFLGHQSLWLDEIFTRQILRETTLSGLWHHVEATESTPPLFYLVGWLTHARSAAAMRLTPALALIAAVPAGYAALRRLIGRREALAAAWILAVSPMLVSYSTDARSYGLFVLCALLSVWAFSALLQHASTASFAAWAAASVACVWTHYFGAFVVGGEVVVLLVCCPQRRRATAAWSAVIALCLVPLIGLAAHQANDERAGFITAVPLGTRVSEAVRQFAMGPNVPRAWLEAAGVVIFAAAVVGGAILAARAGRAPRALLALTLIAFGLPLLAAALGIEDRFYARNVIAVLPMAAALAAPALLRLRALPLVAYVAVAAVGGVWVATDWRYEQVDWRDALAKTQSLDAAAPVVAVTADDAAVVGGYLGRPPASGAGVAATRAWVVVEPVRAAGRRALGPAPVPSLPGFHAIRGLDLKGFQIVLAAADRPTRVLPGQLRGATVFAG